MLKLVRFHNLNKYLQPFEELLVSDESNLILRFLKLSIVIAFITHWFACALYSVGSFEMERYGESWMAKNNLIDGSLTDKYITALYWAATTMCTVGYGDNVPVTPNERILAMIIMILSSGIFAFIINDIGRMVSSFNMLALQFREKMTYVNQFIKRKKLPEGLKL